jgi:hypothetical protein
LRASQLPQSVLWTFGRDGDESMEHQTGNGHEMQAGDHFGQAFVVVGQAAEACRPGEGALHHPAPGQEHEAPFGFRQLDDLQAHPVGCRIRFRLLPSILLIDEPHLHLLGRDLLHRRRQRRDLGPVAGMGRGDLQGPQLAQGIYGSLNLGPRAFLVSE